MNENGKDIYAHVTAKIVADLENGVRSWHRPWTTREGSEVLIPIRHNGVAYRGVNVLLLWIEAMQKGFSSPKWMTYKQAQTLGGQVRKGERGLMAVFAKPLKVTRTDEAGGKLKRKSSSSDATPSSTSSQSMVFPPNVTRSLRMLVHSANGLKL